MYSESGFILDCKLRIIFNQIAICIEEYCFKGYVRKVMFLHKIYG